MRQAVTHRMHSRDRARRFGRALAAWREGRGWSQEVLAARLGVGANTVSAWERGVWSPSRVLLAALYRLGFVGEARPAPSLPLRNVFA